MRQRWAVDRVALALQGRDGATALPAGSGSLTRVGCLRSMSAPYSPTKSHQAGLRCGSVLDAQQLADRFNAARTPVRQALRRLAASGPVVMRPRRGVGVARMSPERIMEAFETMAEIEAMCVLFATYRMTPVERGRLLEPHRSSRPLAAAGDLDAYDAFNRQLHVCLDHATHNSFRVEQAVGIRIRLNALRRTPPRQADRMLQSIEQQHLRPAQALPSSATSNREINSPRSGTLGVALRKVPGARRYPCADTLRRSFSATLLAAAQLIRVDAPAVEIRHTVKV